MKPALRAFSRALSLVVTTGGLLLLSTPATAQSAETRLAAEAVTELLTQRFFEVEFFVFERSAVMDFNTREILTHRHPQPYPSAMLSLPFPDQSFGSSYQIDPMTQLCLTFPTLSYTSTTPRFREQRKANLTNRWFRKFNQL
jgi:hypothetical protein